MLRIIHIALLVAAALQAGADPQVITMTAKKYEFSPSTVTVERGRAVRLEITATDRTHGFEIKEFNIKVKLEKDKKTVVEFTPDKAGEFEIKCSEFCGFGHGRMKGKLVVTEEKKK
ncbi:MAG: cupredoxin domain-containing protein [Acidobacteria bacterium]|nr:cupredoxin domain-containing protein [Acidobacteriota bacterium]MCW5969161.1 cupredoxin domain-containing protein [Blastocatellales bacterium]